MVGGGSVAGGRTRIEAYRGPGPLVPGRSSCEDRFTLESDIVATLNRWDVGLAGKVELYLKPEDGMLSVRLHIVVRRRLSR